MASWKARTLSHQTLPDRAWAQNQHRPLPTITVQAPGASLPSGGEGLNGR
ncbi:hypothetical protein [Dactylosporangium sp. NPDC051541]